MEDKEILYWIAEHYPKEFWEKKAIKHNVDELDKKLGIKGEDNEVI